MLLRNWRHWNYRSTAVVKHKIIGAPIFTRRHVFPHHRRLDHLFGRKNRLAEPFEKKQFKARGISRAFFIGLKPEYY